MFMFPLKNLARKGLKPNQEVVHQNTEISTINWKGLAKVLTNLKTMEMCINKIITL